MLKSWHMIEHAMRANKQKDAIKIFAIIFLTQPNMRESELRVLQ